MKNEIWMLDGIVKHRFRYGVLKHIVERYNRLGIVLQHYNLPELYADNTALAPPVDDDDYDVED